jgi:peptidoglycan/LPS O-acetylase OafA/YrhL
VLVLALAASGLFSDQTQVYVDPIIAIAFAVVISRRDLLQRSIQRKMDHRLAAFSYSFYIVHVPVVLFLIFLCVRLGWLPVRGLDFGAPGAALMLAIFSSAAAVAYLFGRTFESRTDTVRSFLSDRLGLRNAAGHSASPGETRGKEMAC